MKLKPKGRKIYREGSRSERLRILRSNLGGIITTVLLTGVVGFVGYSAGGPIIRFLQERKVLGKPGDYASISRETEPVQTAPAEEPEPETEPLLPDPPALPELRGCLLRTESLASQTALEEALAQVPENTTHIFLPLKVRGGGLYYATALEDVNKSTTVKAILPLDAIFKTVKAQGAEPVAVINALEDFIYPVCYPDAAYLVGGKGWTDPSGKTWMNPFSDMAVAYLTDLTAEIRDAGFSSIVCDGLVFPDFRASELSSLDQRFIEADRYQALVSMVEAMQAAAPEAVFYISANAADILSNRSDAVTAADRLELGAILVQINAATTENADLLRNLSLVHPCVLCWEDTEVPSGEAAYVRTAAPAEPAED